MTMLPLYKVLLICKLSYTCQGIIFIQTWYWSSPPSHRTGGCLFFLRMDAGTLRLGFGMGLDMDLGIKDMVLLEHSFLDLV